MGSHSVSTPFQPVSNPLFPSHSAGGSSGGSAAAVASGSVDVALGTDTGGSVRLPAAYCGVIGVKPSYGRISRWGVVAYANSLDTVGVLADTVDSARKVLKQASAADSRDPTCVTESSRRRLDAVIKRYQANRRKLDNGKKKIRVGVPAEYNISDVTPSMRSAWSRTLNQLHKLGHEITPLSLPSTRHALSAYYVLAASEASSNLAKYDAVCYGSPPSLSLSTPADESGPLYSAIRGSAFEQEVQRRILLGSFALSASAMDNYFLRAQSIRLLIQTDFDRVFACPNPLHPERQYDLSELDGETEMENKLGPKQVDYILVPTATGAPPKSEEVAKMTEMEGWAGDVFTVPSSLAGLPATSVPVKGDEKGLGLQVIGQYWDDEGVLEVCEEIASL